MDQAVFNMVPNFNFSSFIQPPNVSEIVIPFEKDGKNVEKYRKLKKMAIQSNDHSTELKFFAYETHAKFYLVNTSLSEKAFIKAYWLLSNFGSSICRPIVALTVYLMVLFTINVSVINPNHEDCLNNRTSFTAAALTYTLSEALPMIRLGKNQSQLIQTCLFGQKPQNLFHNIWRTIHFVPSAFLLFLFGLGVRNRFKIK